MISVCIPVFNYDVTNLVTNLYEQCTNSKVKFEILLIDDFSDLTFREINSRLADLKNVVYIELDKNIGRSKIRNRLAKKAKFDYLIFMDCDSETENNQYINSYLSYCKGEIIVYGGTAYQKNPPENNKEFLKWYYGKNREVQTAEIRNQNPNKSFKTNNFMISKSIFERIKFDEKITTYGHEDTLFGFELKKNDIKILHIDNPLIHLGLEENEVLLKKTKQAIDNLVYLYKNYQSDKSLFEEIKLLNISLKVKKFRLKWIILLFFTLFQKFILKNLKGNNPKLLFFDFYKLGIIIKNL